MTFSYDEDAKHLVVYKDDGSIIKYVFQEWQMGELFKLILESLAALAPADTATEDEEGEEESGEDEEVEGGEESGEDEDGAEEEEVEDPIFLDTNTMNSVSFGNPEGLSLTTEDDQNYKAVGDLAEMTEEQSTAFWGDAQYAGSKYIAFKVRDISSENPVSVQGWVSSVDSEEYKDQKSGSTSRGKNLAITLGSELRSELEGCYIWKCVLTDGSTYTVDLTDQATV